MKHTNSDVEALRLFAASQAKENFFTVEVGCAACGTRLKVGKLQVRQGEDYEVWELDSEGVVVLCSDCASKIMRSALCGDRASEMWAVRVDGGEHDGASGWVNDEDLILLRRQADAHFDRTLEEVEVRITDHGERHSSFRLRV